MFTFVYQGAPDLEYVKLCYTAPELCSKFNKPKQLASISRRLRSICFLQFHFENAHLLISAKTVHRLIKPLQKPGRFLLPLLNFEQQNKNIISDKKVFNASYTFFDVVTESKIKFHEIFHNFSSIMSSGGTKNLG